jgi:hypothetical protein
VVRRAARFLEDALVNGPALARKMFDRAESKGISKRTLKRAKQELRVRAVRKGEEGQIGGGAWWWELPSKSHQRFSGPALEASFGPLKLMGSWTP